MFYIKYLTMHKVHMHAGAIRQLLHGLCVCTGDNPLAKHVRIQGVDGGSGPHLKNHINIGVLSNTGLDPLKITKLPSQHSMLGHHRHASETPFKWRFAGGPIMARLNWYLDPPSPYQLKKKQKNPSKLDPPEKLSGSAYAKALGLSSRTYAHYTYILYCIVAPSWNAQKWKIMRTDAQTIQ